MVKAGKINYFIILFLIICIFISLLSTFAYMRYGAGIDEGYYLAYASFISKNGISSYKELFNEYSLNPKRWVFPNPLRIGFILISSMWCRIFGHSFVALSYLSLVSFVLLIFITYYFCIRIFDEQKAILMSLLITFSPLAMAMARRALSDSLSTLFLGLTIWLFLDMIYRDPRLIKKIFFLVAFSVAILVKEISSLLVVPFVIFLLIYKYRFKGKVKSSDFLYISLYPASLVLVIYFIFSGNLLRIIETLQLVSMTVDTNQYALSYGSGPCFRYIIDYMLLSPWTIILCLGYVFYLIMNIKSSDAREIYFLVILLSLFFIFNFFTKNIRYVMILDTPIRLFSVLMLYRLVPERLRGDWRFTAIGTIALLICMVDFFNFKELFIIRGIYDPVSAVLLKLRHFIP